MQVYAIFLTNGEVITVTAINKLQIYNMFRNKSIVDVINISQ